MTSVMQLCVCIALSLYSCCLKENFTTLYSHIFCGIFLATALGCSIALYTSNYVIFIAVAVLVSLWTSFIAHNLMAICLTLKNNESFYTALIVQTDLTMLIKKFIKARNNGTKLKSNLQSKHEKEKQTVE